MSDFIQKAYSSIYELPSEVRASFDERDQKMWLDNYTKFLGDGTTEKEIEDAKFKAWKSMVDAPSSLAVESWASTEIRDADGELVPIETIENNMEQFIRNGGTVHDSHTNVVIGNIWGWEKRHNDAYDEDGIVVYFNINHDGEVAERARDDILSGRKNSMSIGAEAPRGGYKCDDRGCYIERDVTDLYEISICETPANQSAVFINVGKDIAKSSYEGEIMRLHVKDIDVHQDYTTCPLQFAKHLLLDITPDVHIVDKRKIIAKAKGKELLMINTIADTGYPFRYNLTKSQIEVIPDYSVEDAIEEAIGNGWACEDAVGHTLLTKKIPKEVFIDWYERGFIHKFGDMWGLSGDDIVKEGGAMGCGCAGASNAVYGSNPQRNRKKRSKKKTTKDAYTDTMNPTVGKARQCPDGYHKALDGQCRLLDAYGKPTGATPQESSSSRKPRKAPRGAQNQSNGKNPTPTKGDAKTPSKRKVDTAKVGFVTVPKGSEGYNIVSNLKVGNSQEAEKSREALVDFYNKNGYIPMIDIKPFDINGRTFDGKTTTYTMFTDENGNYTEERNKVHDEIIKKLLSQFPKPEGRKPIVVFTGGGSASGKGQLDKDLAQYLGVKLDVKRKPEETDKDYDNRVKRVYGKYLEKYKIDPDSIMTMLPEYKEYIKHDMIGGASVFHQEGSDIAKRLFKMAVESGRDFIYDGTFSSKKALDMAKSVDPDKFDKYLVGKLTDVDICRVRSGKRFKYGGDTPRIVPDKILVKSNMGFRDIIKKYDMDEIFNEWKTISDPENAEFKKK